MEDTQVSTQDAIDKNFQFAANQLIHQKKSPAEVRTMLEQQGMDAQGAFIVVDALVIQIEKAKKERSRKDMAFGALWCGGGTVLTLAHIGYIFWGAIVFGAIQFFRGLINSMK